ncbi:MerR family transcriptional regulator [Microbacterium sp. X-17]|uniref:MerR family transcriptional regulator n=1 Tax=Microbacterium sp. X-17 TaxID=3144404 RepID=UPI0031F4821E
MRISELAERTGCSIPTIKFYIREGMLPRGTTTSATRAEYGPEHEGRLRLIHALADVRRLPLSRVREILALVDAPGDDVVETLGRATGALPPYVEDDGDHARARATIEALGLVYTPRFTAVAQLEAAIRGLEEAGLAWDADTVARYGRAMQAVAREEVAPIAAMSPAEAIRYAVLGTALYEPILLALRRLAHQQLLVSGAVPAPHARRGGSPSPPLAPTGDREPTSSSRDHPFDTP